MSYCFRHEPSDDPARMQMFRMHEHVRAGGCRRRVIAWREMWLARAEAFTAALGLDGAVERRHRIRSSAAAARCSPSTSAISASSSRSSRRSPATSARRPIISLNYHQDHFGTAFGIADARRRGRRTPSCVGFGLERIALALYPPPRIRPSRHGRRRSVRELGL